MIAKACWGLLQAIETNEEVEKDMAVGDEDAT